MEVTSGTSFVNLFIDITEKVKQSVKVNISKRYFSHRS